LRNPAPKGWLKPYKERDVDHLSAAAEGNHPMYPKSKARPISSLKHLVVVVNFSMPPTYGRSKGHVLWNVDGWWHKTLRGLRDFTRSQWGYNVYIYIMGCDVDEQTGIWASVCPQTMRCKSML